MGALKYGLVIVIFWIFGFFPNPDDDTITWSSDYRLKWTDFKDKPLLGSRAAALTASGINYRFSTSSGAENLKVDFEVSTHFYPNRSWYKPELCDELILSHEQLHFDIAEVYARRLRTQLSETTFTYANVKSKVREIYRENNEALNDFQHCYDQETNFSRNREEQLKWNKKIRRDLGLEE